MAEVMVTLLVVGADVFGDDVDGVGGAGGEDVVLGLYPGVFILAGVNDGDGGLVPVTVMLSSPEPAGDTSVLLFVSSGVGVDGFARLGVLSAPVVRDETG